MFPCPWEPLQNACGTPAPARAMPCNDVSSAPPAPAGAALPCPNRICHVRIAFAMSESLCHVRIALPCSDRFAMFGSHCHVRMCGERNAMAPQHKGAPRRTERHSANKTGLHDNRSGVTPQTERCGTTNETAWGVKQNAAARRTKRHGAANKMGTDTRTPERCGYRSPFVLRAPAVATSIRVIHLCRPIPCRATARTANPGGGQPPVRLQPIRPQRRPASISPVRRWR